MELQVVRLGTARILQRLGYAEESINFFEGGKLHTRYTLNNYNNIISKANFGESTCSAPYLEEVQKWLRDVYQIYINVETLVRGDGMLVHSWDILYFLSSMHVQTCSRNYPDYEEALREAINQAILKVPK